MVYAYFFLEFSLTIALIIEREGLDIYLSGIKSNRGERLQLGPCLIFNWKIKESLHKFLEI